MGNGDANSKELLDLMAAIESVEFSVACNVASGYSVFLNALLGQPEVLALMDLPAQREVAEFLRDRALDLMGVEHDPNFERGDDVSLACYLMVLRRHHPDCAETVARFLLSGQQGYFWARRVALTVLGLGISERVVYTIS